MIDIPPPTELKKLIRWPVQWTEFYAKVEEKGQLVELYRALEALPKNSIRDARLARVMWRMGEYEQAKALLYKNTKCNLCRAWYFAFLVQGGTPEELTRIVDNFKPDWELRRDLIDLEALHRAHLILGVAAYSIKRKSVAQLHFMKAMNIAEILGDTMGMHIINYESGRMHLFNDDLLQARSVFASLLQKAPKGALRHYAEEYMVVLSWFCGDTPEQLPDWGHQVLWSLRHKTKTISLFFVSHPPTAGVPHMVPLLHQLRLLTQDFNTMLPLYYVEEYLEERRKMVKQIEEHDQSTGQDLIGFISNCAVALARSMNRDLTAADGLKAAFKFPATNVGLMSLTYFATLIQVHANLPDLQDKTDLKPAYETLTKQLNHLPPARKAWLLEWMREFTPTTLYLLARDHPVLQEQIQDYVLVQPGEVTVGGLKRPAYPKAFMVRHVVNLLSGGTIPYNNKVQAHRHRRFLQESGWSHVIYEPVVTMVATWLQ